jgi:hypothetical protein
MLHTDKAAVAQYQQAAHFTHTQLAECNCVCVTLDSIYCKHLMNANCYLLQHLSHIINIRSTRLRNVERYLDSQPHLGGIQARLLRMAKVSEADMRKSVTKLVKDADRFVGQKPTWER